MAVELAFFRFPRGALRSLGGSFRVMPGLLRCPLSLLLGPAAVALPVVVALPVPVVSAVVVVPPLAVVVVAVAVPLLVPCPLPFLPRHLPFPL